MTRWPVILKENSGTSSLGLGDRAKRAQAALAGAHSRRRVTGKRWPRGAGSARPLLGAQVGSRVYFLHGSSGRTMSWSSVP